MQKQKEEETYTDTFVILTWAQWITEQWITYLKQRKTVKLGREYNKILDFPPENDDFPSKDVPHPPVHSVSQTWFDWSTDTRASNKMNSF